jgi:hypothetical protein
MTPAQESFIRNLCAERTIALSADPSILEADLDTPKQASALIDRLKSLPRDPKPSSGDTVALDLRSLPSGRYAVPGGDTRLKVQIDVVTSGKWEGWVFVKDAAVYGSGERYGSQRPGEQYRGKITDALRSILEDPFAAMVAYGHLTSSCGLCGLPLENADSVARGIGPVCATKMSRL